MAYDDVIPLIGEFSKSERRNFILLLLPAIPSAFHAMVGVFLGAQPDFRCLLPFENSENASYHLPLNIMDIAYPWDNTTGSWSQCRRYDLNFTDQNYDFDRSTSAETPTVECDSYVYDKTTYELTTTTEFNLVCNNAWLKATADALFVVGLMLGALIFGGLSDKYGRKPVFCSTAIFNTIAGLLVAVSPNTVSYIIFRLILGTTVNAMYITAYVCVIEMVIPKRRLLVGVSAGMFFTCGYILTTVFAYFLTNWRILQIAITVPNLVIVLYCWFVPESVRWLLSKGYLPEAKALILKACSESGVELPEDKLNVMLRSEMLSLQSDLDKPSVLDLFRYPNLRRKSLLLFIGWFFVNGTYYGLSWNTSNLGGNDYINFAIAAVVEIPACVLVFFTLDRFGRKIILCGCMILGGISLLLIIFVPTNMQWLTLVLAMIGKFAIAAAFETIYVFTAEQYPTVIRNIGVGACSTVARIGAIIAPYILYSSSVWTALPYVIFGSSALISGLLELLLPETLNQKLPESIADGEEFGKKKLVDVEVEESSDHSRIQGNHQAIEKGVVQ